MFNNQNNTLKIRLNQILFYVQFAYNLGDFQKTEIQIFNHENKD